MRKSNYYKLFMLMGLMVLIFGVSCNDTGNSGDDVTTSPLANMKEIEFATFDDGTTSRTIHDDGDWEETDATYRVDYVNNINTKLMVLVPNKLISGIGEIVQVDGDLTQPQFLEMEIDGAAESIDNDDRYYSEKFTIQQVNSSDGYVFHGYWSQRGIIKVDSSFSDGATLDNMPIELFFSNDFSRVRVVLGDTPVNESDMRYGLEYVYNTKSGCLLGQEGTESGGQYEAIDNDTSLTYWTYLTDDSQTEILIGTDTGIEYGYYSTGADNQFRLINDDGTVDNLTTTTELDTVEENLTPEATQAKIEEVFGSADLTGDEFDTLLELHKENINNSEW